MKNFYLFQLLLILAFTGNITRIQSQTFYSANTWDKQGFTVTNDNNQGLHFRFSVPEFSLNDVNTGSETLKSVSIPEVFLPNKEGAPDLPVAGRFIAVPEGADVSIKILKMQTEIFEGVNIAPAPAIPLDNDKSPLKYIRDLSIYSKNAYYPETPVSLSEPMNIRGVDMMQLAVTPFQYNPVTKQLIVYRDMEIEIVFTGGNGKIGDERLRSRWWDPILLDNTLNVNIIPKPDYDRVPEALLQTDGTTTVTTNCEYLIIIPDQADFKAWADSIKQFRTLQGIKTGVVTTTEIGGNTVSAIESYIDNAYNTWSLPPAAILLLGDYGTGSTNIVSPLVAHPSGYPDFASDNVYADVNGDDLPDIVVSRITANDATQLKVMVSKFINYERNPPTKASFYNSPITALGWQTERWFQLCSEVVGGYFRNKAGKTPVRINAVYTGNPTVDPWSTAANTSTIINYFGPAGKGYIPATPQELGGFSGGTTSSVINAINNGSFFLLHRDHGYYQGWGEPAFSTSSVSSLRNVNNELPFVFSINCQTGAYQNSSECLAEKFHRYSYNGQNSGALGVVAPSEVSYSFLNDTYLWGVFNYMFPDFMPDITSTFQKPFVLPAFAMASGKYFLFQSGWSGYGGVYKQTTYRLFHMHGDAFMTLYTQIPQQLTVTHPTSISSSASSISITANQGAFIAITIDGMIVATATASGSPMSLSLPALSSENSLVVTVTKQNYYRYSSKVLITSGIPVADFSSSTTTTCAGSSVTYSDQSLGTPNSWNWSFPGGTPSTSTSKNPTVVYALTGTYPVTLTVTNSYGSNTKTVSGYVTIFSGLPEAAFSADVQTINTGGSVTFSDESSNYPNSWTWSFPGGNPAVSSNKIQPVTYDSPGIYPVTLTVANCQGSVTITKTEFITVKSATLTYCNSTGLNWSNEWISKVELGSFLNASGAYGYTDFTNKIIQVESGKTYSLKLYPGFSGNSRREFWKVWIDYNQNGSFSDPGEEVYTAAGIKTIASGTITFANVLGNLRMRVAMKYNASPSPCESFQNGEVEDYLLTVIPSSSQPPIADFSAQLPEILIGQSVQFLDNSLNNPNQWLWSFPGGSPMSSSDQNPLITYNAPGVYSVTLTATNSNGSNTIIKSDYITVTNATTQYCSSASLTNATEWIVGVKIGTFTNQSGASLYSDFTSLPLSLNPGNSYPVTLTPGFSGNSQKEFWKIWIDFNGDFDFDDSGENILTLNNQRSTVNSTIFIPAGISGFTRMRVAMKNGSSPSPCETFNGGEVEDYLVNFNTENFIATNYGIRIYPNPAKRLVHIFFPGEEAEVILMSAEGKTLKKVTLCNGEPLSVEEFKNGVYFLKISDGYKVSIHKLMKD